MKEEDKNIIVKITTSGDDHCGNSCPYIEIDTYKKISLDSDEEIILAYIMQNVIYIKKS
jgi:hypothetical protein